MKTNSTLFYLLLISSILIILGINLSTFINAYTPTLRFSKTDTFPKISDHRLKIEEVVRGLELPTSMVFLDKDEFLVLEKNKGTVQRIINGSISNTPLLDVNVATKVEQCICGIAVLKNGTTPEITYIYLFYTEAKKEDGGEALGNRVYRYELIDNHLINPKLLLNLPADPGPRHNGGSIIIGPDKNLYITIGDVDGSFNPWGNFTRTLTQNYINSTIVDGRSGILRISPNGLPIDSIFGDEFPLNLYYAYGVRNSFGLDFDPVSGNLWDTENGPGYGDEINLVMPGFNSGYTPIMGLWPHGTNNTLPIANWQIVEDPDKRLVTFEGRGQYSSPEISFGDSLGLTAIKFINSSVYGKEYENDIFVSDVHYGNIYQFNLDKTRTKILLDNGTNPSSQIIMDDVDELRNNNMIIGQGFGGITDLEIGPDGYLYILSIGQGKVYRIIQNLR